MIKVWDFLKARKWLIALIASVLALLLLFGAFAAFTALYSDILPRVEAEGISLGGMSREEAISALGALEDTYGAAKFWVAAGEANTPVSGAELGVSLDAEALADAALRFGKEGNLWRRMLSCGKTLVLGRTLEPIVKLDEELLGLVVAQIAQVNVEPQDATFRVEGEKLILTPPVDGVHYDEEELKKLLKDKFEKRDHSDVTLTMTPWEAKPLNLDEVYQEVHTVAKDAAVETVDGKKVLTPQVVGVDFDLAAAKAALEATPNETVTVALTLTQPQVTTDDLQTSNELFAHTLSKVTTRFSAKKANRVANIQLAAKLIDGTVLNPGDVFSYNEVVGPRTAARGFKSAAVFSGGQVTDGIGGGICQVSSTLYVASIYADLETVSRKNHAFSVDYVPKGQDATVVYGAIDYQFKNNTDAPIKIFASTNSTSVTITIKGTAATQKTVKIESKTVGTTPFTEKVVVDQRLKPGERVIKQTGKAGTQLEVYRAVYDKDGKLIRKDHENTTKYKPMTQIVHVGPNAPATAPTEQVPTQQQPQTPQEQTPTETPSEQPSETPSETPAETPSETPAETPEITEQPAEETPAETTEQAE